MNNCNSINSLALGKPLKKRNSTPKNKEQAILLAQKKSATWSAINKFVRKLEFNQKVVDQNQKKKK